MPAEVTVDNSCYLLYTQVHMTHYDRHLHCMISQEESEAFNAIQEAVAQAHRYPKKPKFYASTTIRFMIYLAKDYFDGKLKYIEK